MERNNRKVYTGTVVSTKMDKTIFHAHDEENIASVGDTVKIMSTRPLSATKRFRLVEIVKKAETV